MLKITLENGSAYEVLPETCLLYTSLYALGKGEKPIPRAGGYYRDDTKPDLCEQAVCHGHAACEALLPALYPVLDI